MRFTLGLSVAAAVLAASLVPAVASAATAPPRGWSIQSSPSLQLPDGDFASIELTAISCRSAHSCSASGSWDDPLGTSQGTLTEHWNGTAWKITSQKSATAVRREATLPTPPGGPWVVACVPGSHRRNCTAVGVKTDPSTSDQFTVARHWNGHRWTRQKMPAASSAIQINLGGISCPTARRCFFVGSDYQGGAAPFFFPLAEQYSRTG